MPRLDFPASIFELNRNCDCKDILAASILCGVYSNSIWFLEMYVDVYSEKSSCVFSGIWIIWTSKVFWMYVWQSAAAQWNSPFLRSFKVGLPAIIHYSQMSRQDFSQDWQQLLLLRLLLQIRMGISPLPSLFKLDSLLCSIELSGDWLGLLVARYILHHQSIVIDTY